MASVSFSVASIVYQVSSDNDCAFWRDFRGFLFRQQLEVPATTRSHLLPDHNSLSAVRILRSEDIDLRNDDNLRETVIETLHLAIEFQKR